MAKQLLDVTKVFQKLTLNSTRLVTSPLLRLHDTNVEKNALPTIISIRNTSFFNKLPADHLWKGVTTVSNAGKKRGRGKTISKKNIKDLNRGQSLGMGKANMVWPGLSAPIIRGRELVQQQKLPEDPEREKKLIELRNTMGTFRPTKLSPMERGWSGSKMPGRSIGAPDPIGEETFEGFDTRVLELKIVFNMKGNFGRKRRNAALVVVGNGRGLGGFAMGRAQEPKNALRKAKNRAAQKLVHIKLFKDHTVCHHFFTQFGSTKIYVWQKPEGYGLRCHRAIKTICEVIGIKNLHAKVEGSTNVNHIMKAFFLGLVQQKTPEQMAEEQGLHLVQFCPESNNFPNVIASPTECKEEKDLIRNETFDFNHYCFGGKVVLRKKHPAPFYTKLDSYMEHLRRCERRRNHDEVKLNLRSEYGEIRSFLTDQHPECVQFKKLKEEETQEAET
ncbi:mitochondrial ribosomal protein S5 isoform X1 [Rhynchophorus ferrugineus]|uniref:mitochondrial ribosomal protein S5 isoform X1 n=1 Tax=Rhynchophorus ferrugineus TaxID=354439 RepID=UPI003FCDE84C